MSTANARLLDHVHGQVNNGCTHPDCQAAYARWSKQWKLDRSRGRTRNVDAAQADRVRAHIDTLRAAGWSLRATAATAGVSDTALSEFMRRPDRRLRVTTAVNVLAIDPGGPPAKSKGGSEPMVSRVGTVRRVQALLAIGWTHALLAQATGVQTHQVISRTGTWVRRSTRDAVADAYPQLAGKPGPSEATRRQAARRGYVPPAAWDDIDNDPTPWSGLDDQAGDVPDFDDVAVARRLDGDTSVRLTRPDRLELVRRAREAGWSYLDIERRAGIPKAERYLHGNDRSDAA